MKVFLLAVAIALLHSTLVQGTVIEGPSDVTYLPGLTPLPIELTCNVTGVALWRVDNTSYTLMQLTNGVLSGHSRTGTNILVNSPVNNTEYICVSLTNDDETDSDPAYIIIAGVPEMVPGVTVDNSSTRINGNIVTRLRLSWGEPFNNFDPIVNYTVSCSGDVTCPPNFNTTYITVIITNLTTMTTYTFSVVAINSYGSGEAGVLSYTTPPGLPNISDIEVNRETCLAVSGSISWTAGSTSPPVSYDVALRSSDEIIVMNNTMNNSFEFTDLMQGRSYTATIVSVSEIGIGVPSMSTFYIPTEQDAMLSGLAITETRAEFNGTLNTTTLTINWMLATNQYCEVLYYLIMLYSNEYSRVMNVSGLSMSTVFINVTNNALYNITVTAFNEAGSLSVTDRNVTVSVDTTTGDEDDFIVPVIVIVIWIILLICVAILLFYLCKIKRRYKDTDEVKLYKIILVCIAVIGICTFGISLLLWWLLYTIMAKYCCSQDSKERTPESAMPLSSPKIKPTEKKPEDKEFEGTTQSYDYAVVDKPLANQQEPNQQGGVTYIDVDISKGPNVMLGGDHSVFYAQTTSNN